MTENSSLFFTGVPEVPASVSNPSSYITTVRLLAQLGLALVYWSVERAPLPTRSRSIPVFVGFNCLSMCFPLHLFLLHCVSQNQDGAYLGPFHVVSNGFPSSCLACLNLAPPTIMVNGEHPPSLQLPPLPKLNIFIITMLLHQN